MMHGSETSDRCVIPVKSVNRAERSAAERMDGGHLVEGICAGGGEQSLSQQVHIRRCLRAGEVFLGDVLPHR
jgi:hypothetical protein